jgi:hypothetical protein
VTDPEGNEHEREERQAPVLCDFPHYQFFRYKNSGPSIAENPIAPIDLSAAFLLGKAIMN